MTPWVSIFRYLLAGLMRSLKMEVTPHNGVNLNSDNYKSGILQIGEDEKGLPEKKVSLDRKPWLENQREVGEPEKPPRERSNVNYAQ